MTPEEENRNFWVRAADAMYGVAPDRGVNPDVFFGGIGGWQSGAGSRFDPTKEIGYFRFNTGNPTRDAIFSIAANELGVDNFVRSIQKMDEGNYWGAAGETILAAASLATFGAAPLLNAASRAKQLYGIGQTFRATPATSFGINRAGPSIFTSRLSPTAQASGQWGFSTPIQHTTTRLSPLERLGRAVGQNRRAPIPAAAADAGLVQRAIRVGRVGMRRLGPLAALGTPLWLWGESRNEPAPTAAEAQARAAQLTDGPPETPRTIRDVTPVGDPIADAGNNARNDVAAINRQYNNILRELQSMYQLSETDEERERLRFMLADIEAQRDAGLQAISQGYAQTVAAIQERGEISRQQSAERAERFGSQLEGYADRAAQRMMLQNLQQQEQFRGLGSGSQTPVNEWVGLMSAMAPLQQQYTQRMGDITGEGIDWMADTVGAQGQAQQADLQRLAAATRSASIMSHQRQVDDRIQREREAQRAAILQTMQMQAGALAGVGSGMLDPFDRLRSIEDWASQGYGSGFIEQSLRDTGQTSLTPGELARIEIMNQRYLGEVPGSAATTPLDPSGN